MSSGSEFVGLEVLVEVGLHSDLMPGRPGFRSGVRPNHWVPGWATTFAGQLSFNDRKWLRPGERCVARGSLLVSADQSSSFIPGFAWHVCEANKIVAAIIAATPIDGSAETLRALATKVRNYATELCSEEYLAEHPDAAGKLRIIICAHGPIDLAARGLIQALTLEVRAQGVTLETEHVPPKTLPERMRGE